MYFLLTFLLKISHRFLPKCAPDRSISISKMQKLPRVGGGGATPSPRSGASRPRLLFPSNIDNLAPPPPGKKFLRYGLVCGSLKFKQLKPADSRRSTMPHPEGGNEGGGGGGGGGGANCYITNLDREVQNLHNIQSLCTN